MMTDDGKRVAWKFDAAIIGRLAPFKPGDPVIVIYREQGGGKAVTAIAFPGTSAKPVYVNTSGERVAARGRSDGRRRLRPAVGHPLSTTTIPVGGQAEVADACWCCAPGRRELHPRQQDRCGDGVPRPLLQVTQGRGRWPGPLSPPWRASGPTTTGCRCSWLLLFFVIFVIPPLAPSGGGRSLAADLLQYLLLVSGVRHAGRGQAAQVRSSPASRSWRSRWTSAAGSSRCPSRGPSG